MKKEEAMDVESSVPGAGSPFVNRIMAPGDVVLDLTKASNVLRLGSGLRQDGDNITMTKVGRLQFKKPNKYWVEGSQKRYIPNTEDVVLGIVVDRRFEVGAALYARVVKAHRDIDPELCCTDASGKAAGFGPLNGGYIFECSTGLARVLLSKPTCPVLEALGKSLSFEIAVGMNGRIWVNAATTTTTILVSNAILNSEFLTAAQQHIMVQKLLQKSQ
ncbi:hypothetical protein CY35_02G195800 [Sphagnum magellanicum]|nr:hypothetical protein CY35_02G195800 [Sphagnum magellanicum]